MLKKHAIIIPYRNRAQHLPILLKSLEKYKDTADIYIFEQNNNLLFNRGQLFNSIFSIEIVYEYYIFHDVDLIPQDDVNYIREYLTPTHLSCYVEQFNYKLLDNVTDYKLSKMFGGVIAISKEHFNLVNGFSNLYEGWGCEDNDMIRRIHNKHLRIDRLPWTYKSLNHDRNNIIYDNLINNNVIYNSDYGNENKIIKNTMKLDKEYDNVKHFLVDIKVNDSKCIILYDLLLESNDLLICLLSAYQIGYSVLLSHLNIEQSTFNYYRLQKHSMNIQDNVRFIHYNDLLLYILNGKIIYNKIKLNVYIDIYDYDEHIFKKQKYMGPCIGNDPGFNYFIYKLLNPDLIDMNRYELFNHYNTQGKNENRIMSFNLVKDFNIFTYYEYNKDLHHMNIFERNIFKNISCIQIINHYNTQGKNENRIINNNDIINIRNIDWLYTRYNINCKYVCSYYKMKFEKSMKIPLLKVHFPIINCQNEMRTLIITHPGGGGVEKYLNALIGYFPKNIILKPNSIDHTLYICDNKYFFEPNILQLYEYICSYNINLIIINHMSIYTPQMFQMFQAIKNNFNCNSIVILHDITYLKSNNRLSYNLCRIQCMDNANLIIAPSKYIQKFYNRGVFYPHPDMTNYTITGKKILHGEKMKILVIGDNKGSRNIRRYLKDNIKNEIIYLGKIDIINDNLYNLGSYQDNELLSIIKQINPHFIWY